MTAQEHLDGVIAAFDQTTYAQWMKAEDVGVIDGFVVEDVRQVPVSPWPRLGCSATMLNLYALMEGAKGMFVAEIPPGGTTEPQRHLYEQVILVLEGQGTTEIWQTGDAHKHVFEWHRGSVFSPPLNTSYRLFNLGKEPARFLAVNDAPAIMNGFRDAELVFDCNHVFRERFSGQDGYFAASQDRYSKGTTNLWFTNFIPDALSAELMPGEYKGAGNRRIQFEMSGNALVGHMAEWPMGRYHKAHYHPAGPVLLGLRSEGYVLIWPKEAGIRPYEAGNEDQVIAATWKQGSLYAPPTDWFHQHFNTGPEPARHIAVRHGSRRAGPGFGPVTPQVGRLGLMTSTEDGGSLIEYEDEDPEIRKRYAQALQRSGVANNMPDGLYVRGAAKANPDDPRNAEE